MAEVAIQKEASPERAVRPRALSREWEPFRLMRDLMRWDPFGEMAPTWPAFEAQAFNAAFDVKETKEAFVFTADLPGIEEKDLEVKLAQNRLSISGKRESEKTERGDTYYTCERSSGSFLRTFTLPDGVDGDKIKAELKSGVLNVTVPKKPEAQPKKINVSAK